MKNSFIQYKGMARRDKGRKLIDATIDNKSMHYFYDALAKYQEFVTDKREKIELELLINELNELNNQLNEG